MKDKFGNEPGELRLNILIGFITIAFTALICWYS